MDRLQHLRRAKVVDDINNFRLFGDLRKTNFEPRKQVSLESTIHAERSMLMFEQRRKRYPDKVCYKDLYTSLIQSLPSYNVSPRDVRRLTWNT
ncbi:hypothetical protein SNE40_016649 [Patella caerulea]|uniref:Uncharacterized protein n=1 Tax=Patella caerulea TaxID=87958 RepID=A0AAN8JEK0_PATCE